MKHTEKEMQALKASVREMWMLVLSQLDKAKQAYLNSDIELALEVLGREKRVDAFDLKIDSDCENYIALYSPVAVDLRLVLSLIKICSTLERIGDFAAGIARHILEKDCNDVAEQVIQELEIEQMMDLLIGMLSDSFVILESEDTKLAGRLLARDEQVDTIYRKAIKRLPELIETNVLSANCALKLLLVIRKLERIGDHCSNIVEELVFFVDAKVLRHNAHLLLEK